jgi:hypothetical protein
VVTLLCSQVLMDNCGAALGVFVSCLFNDM